MNTKNVPLITIIDDEKHIRESLSQYLTDIGHYRTKIFKDGREAIDWFIKNSSDVCIVDIKMPGINGFETIEEIRKKHPDQNFIIFTGSRFQDIPLMSQKFNIPIEYIIVKPLPTMEIFLDKVAKILDN
ncbi:MAG: response regulator [Candidatus Aureabacteria bacterium]|nr:response regulator [Candidatus Auribacterota bacterium]